MMLKQSWVESANSAETPFPLNNLPCGALLVDGAPHCGVAIGEMILDVTAMEAAGTLSVPGAKTPPFRSGKWNAFMALGPDAWTWLRAELTDLLAEGSARRDAAEPFLVPMAGAEMVMPFAVAEYTDFYAGRNHAENVGTIFRGPENALPANWLSIPIGYNGRASSVVVSGTPITRPWGQVKGPDEALPRFVPSARFDLELELGAIVGQPSDGPVTVAEADDMIFGYVLLNDWSARDIQAWEYVPLGPFQAKATATTISPWIVTKAALEPFRVAGPERARPLLPYLEEPGPMLYDIALDVSLAAKGRPATTISRTNARELYYSAAQQLAHHTTSGCPMRVGDLLGSGTISGPTPGSRGSLLELAWSGKEPVKIAGGETRSFLQDGDTLTLTGSARGEGYTIGFGPCSGTVEPALDDPYAR